MVVNSFLSSAFSLDLEDLVEVEVDMFSTSCAANVEGGGCASSRRATWLAADGRFPWGVEVMAMADSHREA